MKHPDYCSRNKICLFRIVLACDKSRIFEEFHKTMSKLYLEREFCNEDVNKNHNLFSRPFHLVKFGHNKNRNVRNIENIHYFLDPGQMTEVLKYF